MRSIVLQNNLVITQHHSSGYFITFDNDANIAIVEVHEELHGFRGTTADIGVQLTNISPVNSKSHDSRRGAKLHIHSRTLLFEISSGELLAILRFYGVRGCKTATA